jgi:antitoxin ChpS
MRPITRPRHTLAELLAECDPDAPVSEADRVWLDGPPAGEEII